MIGIKAVASYVPEHGIDNVAQARSLGETVEFLTKKVGAFYLPQKAEEEETSDLAIKATQNLIKKSQLTLDSIDAIVVVTQNGDGTGLPHTSAIVQSRLGLQKHIAAFDISLGCSGYVYGLSILKGFMDQVGLENGVLITADPYSKIIDRNDRITTLLFGDAATATWLGESPNWQLLQPVLDTDGSGSDNLLVQNGRLIMNGRQVFNFASKQVPKQIKQCLFANTLDEEDIDLYCIHQGSASIVEAVAKRFPQVRNRFVSDIKETGNTVSSSIPVLLEKNIDDPHYSRILLSGFGVGLSWATNIISREN